MGYKFTEAGVDTNKSFWEDLKLQEVSSGMSLPSGLHSKAEL